MSNETRQIENGLVLTEIRIWPMRDAQALRVKATVSLTFNDVLRVNGCRIIEGAKGLFLSYPSEKRPGRDEWDSFVHPTERDASNRIQAKVLEDFENLVNTRMIKS